MCTVGCTCICAMKEEKKQKKHRCYNTVHIKDIQLHVHVVTAPSFKCNNIHDIYGRVHTCIYNMRYLLLIGCTLPSSCTCTCTCMFLPDMSMYMYMYITIYTAHVLVHVHVKNHKIKKLYMYGMGTFCKDTEHP